MAGATLKGPPFQGDKVTEKISFKYEVGLQNTLRR